MRTEADDVIDALQSGTFLISVHAVRRMKQRSITRADIQSCGQTAAACHYQADHGTYRVEGQDLDGESITVICGVDRDVVIVTIF